MNKDEALKMAIEWVEGWKGIAPSKIELLRVLREALAQPAQEPVAMYENGNVNWINTPKDNSPLYTHPAPSTSQEPVAWIEVTTHHEKYQTSKVILLDKGIKLPHDTLLYTHPAPPCQECENLKHDLEGYMDANKALINREWQGLTSEEIRNLDLDNDVISVIFQTEKLLKEKNT